MDDKQLDENKFENALEDEALDEVAGGNFDQEDAVMKIMSAINRGDKAEARLLYKVWGAKLLGPYKDFIQREFKRKFNEDI